jgi:hypothetical protein
MIAIALLMTVAATVAASLECTVASMGLLGGAVLIARYLM